MDTQTTKNKSEIAVHGVTLGAVDPKQVKKVLKQEGLTVPKEAKVEDLVAILATHYATKYTKDQLAQCDTCNGQSPETLDECPYCGTDFDDELDESKPVAAAPTNGHALAKAPSSDLTPASSVLTERELNEGVKKILELKGQVAVSHWHLGRAITILFTAQLWKLRQRDGKQAYKSWDAFAANELHMTPTNAYQLMDVAKEYSEEQVRAWGYRKLALVLTAPKEEQPALLGKVAEGATKREIAEEVKKAKAKSGHTRASRNAEGRGGPRASGGRKAEEKVTVATILGNTKVKLYKKPLKKKWDPAELVPAKRLADEPFGEEELPNGVVQRFFIVESSTGHLELKVQRFRREAEAAE